MRENSLKIVPLSGQALVEILPENKVSEGGIVIPETARGKDDVGRLPGVKARVVRLGPWRKVKTGLAVVPDFAPGATVFVSQYAGKKAHEPGRDYRLVRVEDVLACLI